MICDEQIKLHEEQSNPVRRKYIEVAREIIGGDLYLKDFFFTASVNKEIRLLDGAMMTHKARNITCCAVPYRAQIDLCMRTYVPFIAKDSQELIRGYIGGKPIRKYKSKDGEKLADAYLKKQLDIRFPGLSASYSQASDFVHFSKEAFFLIARLKKKTL